MRADKFLAGHFDSRTKAAEEIEKGRVLVGGKRIRAKDDIKETDEITFLPPEEYFVSNGGYKLSRALKTFDFSVLDMICADIGASTGGFTDCLLQRGAKRVYAVDVGESLLHESLQNDDRVCVMDNVNARYLQREDFSDELDLVTADVSFISLRLILPTIFRVLKDGGFAFVLIKPQFECENKNIGKSGIVPVSAHKKIVETVLKSVQEEGFFACDIVNAPIKKGKNVEYVLLVQKIRKKSEDWRILKSLEELWLAHSEGNLL